MTEEEQESAGSQAWQNVREEPLSWGEIAKIHKLLYGVPGAIW